MRKTYIVNWKFQLKYSILAVLPLLILGFLIIGMVFNISKGLIVSQKQQLMTQLALLEQSLNFLDRTDTDKRVIGELRKNVKSLKSFSQDLIKLNTFQWASLNRVAIKGVAVFTIGGILLWLVFSHRVAGPIYRVQRILHDWRHNHAVPPIKVRPTDEFQDLFAGIEEIRKQSVDERERRRVVIDRVLSDIDVLAKKAGGDVSRDLLKLKDEIVKLKDMAQ